MYIIQCYLIVKCRKQKQSKCPRVVKIKFRRIMLLSNSAVCDSKKLKFIKEQEASGIIGSLAKSLSKISFVGPIVF